MLYVDKTTVKLIDLVSLEVLKSEESEIWEGCVSDPKPSEHLYQYGSMTDVSLAASREKGRSGLRYNFIAGTAEAED